jgi:hypothetical protein
MTVHDKNGVLTITSWGSRAAVGLWVLILAGPLTFVLAALLHALGQPWAAFVVVFSAVGLALWRVVGQRCEVSEADLVVHDVLHTRRVSRGEIRLIRQLDPTWGVLLARGQSPGWWVRVETKDGTYFHPGALARWRDHSDWDRFAGAMNMTIVDAQPV